MGRIYGDQPVFRQAWAKQSLQMLVAVFFEKIILLKLQSNLKYSAPEV